MHELNNPEWFEVRGKGKIASFGKDSLPDDVWEPGELFDTVVKIDGKQYYVSGVEMFMLNIRTKNSFIHSKFTMPKHGYNHNYGLVVRELDSNASGE